MKHFTSVADITDINQLVQQALLYKANPYVAADLGKHKKVGLLFLNPSLRTRISTQIAAKNLGLEVIVFNIDKEGWNLELNEFAIMNGTSVEHIKDAAPVLGTYFDILCVRSFPALIDREEDNKDSLIALLKQYCGIPIVSLESNTLHPLQSCADIMTIQELYTGIAKPKIVMSWAPHVKAIPHCVAHSFAQWVNHWGAAEFVITHPEGYELDPAYTAGANICYDQEKALQDADFVYVKNWCSYAHYGHVLCTEPSWMLSAERLKNTNQARVMHCLPLRRNVELSSDVLDGSNSVVTQQAANRVWAAQAVLSEILKKN